MKWNARVMTDITFDFEIEANCEDEVFEKIGVYLKYVDKGKLDTQLLTIKTLPEDVLTNIFVMETEIEDVYELD